MTMKAVARFITTAVAVALFLTACDGSTTGSGSSRGSGGSAPVTDQALVTVPHVGKMTWSCGGRHPAGAYSVSLGADSMSATDIVHYNLGGENDTRKVLQPGKKLSSPYSKADQIWHVVQTTEPRTLTVDLDIHFKTCSRNHPPKVEQTVKTAQH